MTNHGNLHEAARDFYESSWDPDRPTGAWFRLMHDEQWAYPTWPEQWGGRGLGVSEAKIVREARRSVGALGPPSGIGPTLLAPMLFRHGTDEQCARILTELAYGDSSFCQMLSEPDAGSDLAAARLTAERDGNEWVVNGSKIWTSNADLVDYGMLLARSRWDLPKHQGLTFLLIERDQPGIEIHPLRQMTGDTRFNQVFFNDARVPDTNRLGAELDGWAVARTFLAHEKNSYNPSAHEGGPFAKVDQAAPAGAVVESMQRASKRAQSNRGAGRLLADLAERFGATSDPLTRQDLIRLRTTRSIMTYTSQRSRAATTPGPEASISKITVSALTRAQRDVGLGLLGPYGQLSGDDAPSNAFANFALGTPANSIAGGTDEIQRNHIGERVLGLPSEPKPDPNVPFGDTP
ncbi:MAG: acyl-CoA dehydrogenase family protein [Actinomycetota bacterium]|nr:acyl-CoA dehydrogenase family protein [Actinomycetota bacterium]